MKRHGTPIRPTNPFSIRFIRPGAIPYLFPPGQNAAQLVARLAASGWRGQIVGPHGSGKSTLLASLDEPLSAAGRRCHRVSLHDGARRLPAGCLKRAQRAGANLLVIDGYEQLGARGRLALRAACRWRGWGLLVTAHRDTGLPTLLEIAPDVERAQKVVRRLVPEDHASISPRCVAECFDACDGNVRETLFALYDRWEARRG